MTLTVTVTDSRLLLIAAFNRFKSKFPVLDTRKRDLDTFFLFIYITLDFVGFLPVAPDALRANAKMVMPLAEIKKAHQPSENGMNARQNRFDD